MDGNCPGSGRGKCAAVGIANEIAEKIALSTGSWWNCEDVEQKEQDTEPGSKSIVL